MTQAVGAALSQHAARIGLGILWLAAGVAAVAPPREMPADGESRALERMMEPVARGAAVGLQVAPDGDVWWITAERAIRFEAGEPARPRVVLDLRARRVGLRGEPDPITAAHVDDGGTLWLGTRHGAVWSHRDGAWRPLATGSGGERRPIAAIATRGDQVYVAGSGLWRGGRQGPLEALPAFEGAPVAHAVAHPEHGVAVVARGGVWRSAGAAWREVWRPGVGDGAVSALSISPEGELWIGTTRGLVRLDGDGRERRELAGTPIASLAAGRHGSAYAGTRGAGLFARYARGWRRVDAAGERGVSHVTGLASAPGGALWLALGDGDLLRAGPADHPLAHVSAR